MQRPRKKLKLHFAERHYYIIRTGNYYSRRPSGLSPILLTTPSIFPRHMSAPLHVQQNNEFLYKAINDAYNLLMDDTMRYRQTSSPGRSGFHRSRPPSSTHYWQQKQQHQSTFDRRRFWRVFKSSGSHTITALLGGVMLTSIIFVGPFLNRLWDRHNSGKLFKGMEQEMKAKRNNYNERN